jgi:hypothetical protein
MRKTIAMLKDLLPLLIALTLPLPAGDGRFAADTGQDAVRADRPDVLLPPPRVVHVMGNGLWLNF